jgi:hypothetical protein
MRIQNKPFSVSKHSVIEAFYRKRYRKTTTKFLRLLCHVSFATQIPIMKTEATNLN